MEGLVFGEGGKPEYPGKIHNSSFLRDGLESSLEGSKSSTYYLNDTNRFDVPSKGPSSGISREFNSHSTPDEGHLLETSNLFVSLR